MIENEFFRLQVDAARGGVVSLVDLKTGRELVAATGRKQFRLLLAGTVCQDECGCVCESVLPRLGASPASDFNKPIPGVAAIALRGAHG